MTEVILAEEFCQRTIWPRTQAEMIGENESCIWICPEPYGDGRLATHCVIWSEGDGRDIASEIEIVDFRRGLSRELAVEAVQSIACRLGIDKIVVDLAPTRK